MSNGKIQKPSNPDLPANLTKLPMEEMIYEVIQTCAVEVEDTEWKSADTKLKEDISAVEDLIKGIDDRLGKDKVDLSEELRLLKTEVEGLKARRPLDLIVKLDKKKPKDLGMQHVQLPTLIKVLSAQMNVYLVGPAGSGKTHAAIQCAKALAVPFHFTGAVASEFKLTGFIDAQGRIVSTEFRKAFENGGLFLFDEIDASYPQAVLAFNAALANDYMDFPDKRVERHENFYCIAAANTYGQGADRQYVGRNQLDAASLDRFVFIDWQYDENLETALAGNADWSSHVQRVRRFVVGDKIRHVVSPRASMFGAKLLATGLSQQVVEAIVLWKGMDDATKNKIIEGIEPRVQVKVDQAGRFEPVVEIGQRVKKDDVIGNLAIGSHYHKEVIALMAPRSGEVIEIIEKEGVQAGEIVATIRW